MSFHAAQRRRPWRLLTPTLAVMALLMAWPLGRVVWLSFQNYGLREINRGTTNFTGVENYRDVLGDGYLWRTVLPNTVLFALACVAATVALGTLVALFLKTLPTGVRYVAASAIMVAWACLLYTSRCV